MWAQFISREGDVLSVCWGSFASVCGEDDATRLKALRQAKIPFVILWVFVADASRPGISGMINLPHFSWFYVFFELALESD
jgi:hypothetical protein